MKKIKTSRLIILLVVLFAASTGLSYRAFSADGQALPVSPSVTPETPKADSQFTFDPEAPKTEESPVNGETLSEAEFEFYTQRYPLGVMIENHVDARPQSGLSSADVVYEAVAEGGITRFMAIFWSVHDDTAIAPVRSARTYFLDWISEYDGLYAHVGGANCNLSTGSGCANGAPADALGQIDEYGIKSLNQYRYGFPTYERNYERLGRTVATEHTMVSSTDRLWELADENGWKGDEWLEDFRPWKFKDAPEVEARPTNQTIEFGFWEGSFNGAFEVVWEYDPETNSYARTMGGQPHLDLNNREQITAKNIAVLFMDESPANDGYPGNPRLLYDTIGSGQALIFRDGEMIEGSWEKQSRPDRTLFFDENGDEVSLTRGPIWIEVLPTGNEVIVSPESR